VAGAASLAAEAPPKDHFDWTILGSQPPWIPLTSPTRMFQSQLFRYRIRAGGMGNGAPADGGMSNGAPRASGVPAGVCCFTPVNMFSNVFVQIFIPCIHADISLSYMLQLMVPKQARDCQFLFILLCFCFFVLVHPFRIVPLSWSVSPYLEVVL